MKKFICFVLSVALCFFVVYEIKKENFEIPHFLENTTEAYTKSEENTEVAVAENTKNNGKSEEIRAVWFTYSEISGIVKGKSEKEYRASLKNIFENLKSGKINTVFYQARAFCDALYDSEVFPISKYISNDGKNLSYDPLEVFVEFSKEYNISVHAWVNPFRVSYSSNYKSLPENSPAVSLYKNNKTNLMICDKGIYLNPASENARELVMSGVREIIEKYDVDGIHFDDYFYPESDDLSDKTNYNEYKKAGGRLTLSQWRCENVTSLIGSVYSLVKSKSQNLVFGISPAGSIDKCTNTYFADVKKWCSGEGYIDYILPQIYYGFENSNISFLRCASDWENIVDTESVRLICGLAVYKCGQIDENAGVGENEWVDNDDILFKQYKYIAESDLWSGFSYFSYSYSFGEKSDNSKKEIKNISNMVE